VNTLQASATQTTKPATKPIGKLTAKPKVALGMSGGVDSSLCAHLLVEHGYDVTGVYMECWRAPGCRTDQDRKDALTVALELNIPFQVLDFKTTYKEKVVELFFQDYAAGLTPNPDVLCNKEIKFGLFYDWAMKEGFEYVATGHYAKIITPDSDKKPQLAIPTDTHKDQTYFLYPITTKQLEHTLFPLQDMTKDQVRQEAVARKLHVASKKDSVGICFIGDINVHDFLRERLGENPGDVVTKEGTVIGRHKGLWFYTVGQRHGFTIFHKSIHTLASGEKISKENIPPFYVISKNPEKNELVVGFGHDTTTDTIIVNSIHFIDPDTNLQQIPSKELFVRIRHTGKLEPVKQIIEDQNRLIIKLETAVAGIAAGQSAVLYHTKKDGYICLGGGVIL